jgi:hypothetical protein
MYCQDKDQEKFCRPDIWSNIDPLKVKQRIDKITHRLERVRRLFEPSESENSCEKSP